MIPEINKILYATDLTPNSAYAFYFAADMARNHDARIVILHCMTPIPPAVYYEAGIGGDRTLDKAKELERVEDVALIKKHLQEVCQKVETESGLACVNLVSDIIVKTAYAVEEILNTADREKCDVIVLGTHGKGWLAMAFLGSVARSVLERTRKPTFLVPLPPEKNSTDWGTL